jgi:hypothetical protein
MPVSRLHGRGDLGLTFQNEGGNAADELAVAGDRAQRDVGRGSHPVISELMHRYGHASAR